MLRALSSSAGRSLRAALQLRLLQQLPPPLPAPCQLSAAGHSLRQLSVGAAAGPPALRTGAEQEAPSAPSSSSSSSSSSSAAAGSEDSAAAASSSPAPPSSPTAAAAAAWAALGLPSHLKGKLDKVIGSSALPTAVQLAALEPLCRHLSRPLPDAVLHSETGTGKTLSYLLPVLARLDASALPTARLRAVIMTPTRELAHQVSEVAAALGAAGKHKDPERALRVLKVVGEVSAQTLFELKERPPHVLVGTPATLARLLPAHVNTGELQVLVLDEADELLRSHTSAAVLEVCSVALKHKGRPGVLCVSATSSFSLQKFVRESLRKHSGGAGGGAMVVVDTTGGALAVPGTLTHLMLRYHKASSMYNSFTRVLAALRPPAVLSFHNSALSMEALEGHLKDKHIRCCVMGNAYANAVKAASLDAIRKGKSQVLLSTEMAARGLDIPRLSHVINFDPPSSLREYVHRAGRAGRLSSLTPGRAGTVLTLVGSEVEAAALVDMCGELGVALSELSITAGMPSTLPILAPAKDLAAHRKSSSLAASRIRTPSARQPSAAVAGPAALASASALASSSA
jgi:superfamily II DNA/RNA helicase